MGSGRITAIKRKGNDQYSVYIDGVFAFSASQASIDKYNLSVNDILDNDIQNKLKDLDQEEQALSCALRILSRRSNSRSELKHKLMSKGFSSNEVENVLEKLTDMGYLDDVRFAESWRDFRIQEKNMGRQRIKQEVFEKGVSNEIIHSCLEHISLEDEVATAMIVAEKNLPRYKNVSPDVRKRRLLVFMRRSYETVTSV